jgi:hypothetical protein
MWLNGIRPVCICLIIAWPAFAQNVTGDLPATPSGGGYTTVVVTRLGGATPAIFFRDGTPIDADTSEADPGAFSATRESDLNTIPIGDERYETPDAVVLGG